MGEQHSPLLLSKDGYNHILPPTRLSGYGWVEFMEVCINGEDYTLYQQDGHYALTVRVYEVVLFSDDVELIVQRIASMKGVRT